MNWSMATCRTHGDCAVMAPSCRLSWKGDAMLTTIAGVPTHALFVGLGVLAAVLVFVAEARRRGHTDDRLLLVVTGALVGGALFMRLGTWLQHVDLRDNATLAEQ